MTNVSSQIILSQSYSRGEVFSKYIVVMAEILSAGCLNTEYTVIEFYKNRERNEANNCSAGNIKRQGNQKQMLKPV